MSQILATSATSTELRSGPRSPCRVLAALLLALLGASACSKDAVLDAVRRNAETHYDNQRQQRLRECELLPSEPQRERCRQELPPASFDEYERLRRTLPRLSSGADLHR